jgi:DNA-binding winged helix-turn-helix (wHTH) protein/TolB-like protein/tetratricopeptide (TPR) repeat protein
MIASKPPYEFGPFRLDPIERRLMRLGEPVAIAPKCFDLLVVLVENGGHLLEKEELLARLWPDQFVEESNLSFQVSCLRKILGEGLNGEHYIETVPKKGFRFVATIAEYRGTETDPMLEHQDGTLPTENRDEASPVQALGAEESNEDSASHTYRMSWSRLVFTVLVIGALSHSYVLWSRRAVAPVHSIRTIAVLPFKPISADSRNESLEMGLAATLIGRLSGIKQIVVRQISDVRKYTDVHQDPVKAGQELRVEAVLDGSIQKDGNRVRVTVRLINVETGATIWGDKFDGDTDIFKLQDSIAERVVQELSVSSLTGEEQEQLTKHSTENSEAYELYMDASYIFNKDSSAIFENKRKGLKLYESAIEKDPKFALAYVGIAEFYLNPAPLLTSLSPMERIPKAREAILKALELDNTLAEAHNALAELKYQYDFDWSGAEEHFKQAINLNPNVAYIRLAHGWYLMCVGNFEQADAELEKAQQLDSRSLGISRARSMLLLYERQYDKAIKHYLRMREVEPDSHRTNWYMSMAYQGKGMYAEAVEEFLEHGRTIKFLTPQEILGLREAFQTRGWQGFLRQRLVVANGKPKGVPTISPALRAGIYALLGDKDPAFEWLEKGIEEHDPEMSKLKIEPAYDNLRSDPRFVKILQRLNLL